MRDASPCRRLDGATVVRALRTRCVEVRRASTASPTRPRLDVIRVGDHAGARSQVAALTRLAETWGIEVAVERLPATSSARAVRRCLKQASTEPDVHGALLASPLPARLDRAALLDALALAKDVEGAHPTSQARFLGGQAPLEPAAVVALRALLDAAGRSPGDGRSVVVARPGVLACLLAAALHQGGHAPRLIRPEEASPEALRRADILVLVDGEPEGIDDRAVRSGATVIDFGVHVTQSGRLVGHANGEAVARAAGALTPVPGGVGPVLAGAVLANVTRAARGIVDPAGGQELPLFGGAGT